MPSINAETTRMHSSRMRTSRSSSHREWWSASVHAGIPPPPGVGLETQPWVWAWKPPWVWPWRTPLGVSLETPRVWPGDPPRPDPSTFPSSVGLETPPPPARPLKFPTGCGSGNLYGMLGYHPPKELLQGMLGYLLQCPPPQPMNRITEAFKT